MNRILLAALVLSSSAAHAAVTQVAEVTVTGGSNPGKYQASSEKGGCSYGLVGPDAWGAQMSDPKEPDPKKLNSIQLIVPDTKKAAGGTSEFLLSVGFGPLMKRSATYAVDTRSTPGAGKSGSGKVTVEDKGTTGFVKFEITTAAGVKVAGTLECKSVMRTVK
jgi:hypothetical protein